MKTVLQSLTLCAIAGALAAQTDNPPVIPGKIGFAVAGDISREILTQLDDMLEDQSFEYLFIRDLPDHHHGAFVFRNGFENALVMFVSTPIVFPEHGRISQADWDRYAAKRRAEPDFYPDVLLLRWMPDKRRFVTP